MAEKTTSDKKLLLVEDNPDDRDLTLRALRSNNLVNEIVVANDGVEALEYLHGAGCEERGLPQLVLLDLKLPRVSGLEVLERVRKEKRTALLPVVILTSSVEEEDRLNGYGLGANSYVRKPVDFERFTETVRQLGMYWLLVNEPPPMYG
jgi:two-component system, response regulator